MRRLLIPPILGFLALTKTLLTSILMPFAVAADRALTIGLTFLDSFLPMPAMAGDFSHQYATQAAWLEDNRRQSNGGMAFGLVANAMGCPVSRAWKGYWQRAI